MSRLIPKPDDDIGSFFDKRFTGKWDLPQPMIVKITGVERGEIEARKDNPDKGIKRGEKQRFPFLHIRNLDAEMKPIKMNKTMMGVMIDLYGRKPAAWIGKFIEIYHDTSVTFGKSKVGGIAIRAERPNVTEESRAQAPAENADEQKRELKSAIEREEALEASRTFTDGGDPNEKAAGLAAGPSTFDDLLARSSKPATKEEQSKIWKEIQVASRSLKITKEQRDTLEAALKANRASDATEGT